LIRLDSAERNLNPANARATHQQPLPHALPTTQAQYLDLAAVVDAWPTLPEVIRQSIAALVKVAAGDCR
jgi:hypothetical protein